MGRAKPFPLVDTYMGLLLGTDLSRLVPGRTTVVESDRRLRGQLSWGFIHALWWLWLEDGRSVVSIPPGAHSAVAEVAANVRSREELFRPGLAEELEVPVNAVLTAAGLSAVDRVLHDLAFACGRGLLRRHKHGDCRRLTDNSVPPAPGLSLPEQCFPDGIVYGVLVEGLVASLAHAHRTGIMEDQVADLGVETAVGYRRRGYAKTVVSAVVGHLTGCGGEAIYKCSPDNQASAATARSVGFVPYGRSLVLATPRAT
jgi:hypothetical protein